MLDRQIMLFVWSFINAKAVILILSVCMECINVAAHTIQSNNDGITSRTTGQEKIEDANFWRTSAMADLAQTLRENEIIAEAKNVIMFLGDGWDMETITAARILKGQKVDLVKYGEEAKLYLEKFHSVGISKTYCVDNQVADSACSTTAFLGGVKANEGTIGVTQDVIYGNCSAQHIPANQVQGIVSWAQAAGKSTGVVTTTTVTHATPAGCYAHTADRDWECDADMIYLGADPNACDDIAKQLILREPGKHMNVIMGGGRTKFLPNTVVDSEGARGERADGQNLIETWKTMKAGSNGVFVESAQELAAVNVSSTDNLLGLFSPSHMAYYHEQAADGDPRLVDMTHKAIEILSKNPKGFFLLVEGGRIDHAHHANQAQRSLWESIEFDRAIQQGDQMTDDCDTLIVVTADHGHVMSFAGYSPRGNDIMGVAGFGADNLPYSTLNYANGPGWKPFDNEKRHDISEDDLGSLTYSEVPLVPLPIETHGGQDVLIVAKGPFSHLFSGFHEQNYIPFAMGYASCIGYGPTFCHDPKYQSGSNLGYNCVSNSNQGTGSGWHKGTRYQK